MIRLDTRLGADLLALLEQVPPSERRDELMQLIREQIERPMWAGDLLDTISGYLIRSNPANVISGGNLDRMRRALLSPRELAEFDALPKSGLNCSVCGKRVDPSELCSVHGTNVVCSNCLMPSFITCKCGYHAPVELKAKIARAHRECKHCKAIAAGKEKPKAEAINDARDAIDMQFAGNEQPQVRRAPRPPAAFRPLREGNEIRGRWREALNQGIGQEQPNPFEPAPVPPLDEIRRLVDEIGMREPGNVPERDQ